MILSMTGFGRAEGVFLDKKITVEIKSLNSKSFDLNLKIPFRYKEKDFEIRKILNDSLQRGKIDCYLNVESLSETSNIGVNQDVVKAYINQLKEIIPEAKEVEYLKMAIRMPEAINAKPSEVSKEEEKSLLGIINEALVNFQKFRKTEGEVLEIELEKYINNIAKNLSLIEPFEEDRINTVKERYKNALKDFQNIDETRYYQEVVYYTEKFDIVEEKVRLSQHLKYYLEVMLGESFNGKKLGFISQEIGREVNTLGSKANHHEIQKLVVTMKDDLEKIKEQTLNVL